MTKVDFIKFLKKGHISPTLREKLLISKLITVLLIKKEILVYGHFHFIVFSPSLANIPIQPEGAGFIG